MHSPLTFRQERFVFEFLKDQNASAAAARAGYTARNMAAQGNELMSHPEVACRVRIEMQSMLAEIRCSAIELMKQRVRIAFFDPAKLVDGWEPVALDQLDAETRSALDVSTVTRKSGPVVRVKQGDRHKALRALERAHERMEQLNEKYYAKLEKEGRLPDWDEIDRQADEAEAAARQAVDAFPEKPQVLSGSPSTPAIPASQKSKKHQVLLGGPMLPPQMPPARFAKKPQVLSGWLQNAWAPPPAVPAFSATT